MEQPKEALELECTQTLKCPHGAFRSCAWNVDGNYCLTSSSDKSVILWNPFRNKLLQSYVGHGSEALTARSSNDNALIASGGADRTVILWTVETGVPLRRWREHAGKITSVCFNELSSVVLSASADGTGAAWDARSKSRDAIITFGKFGDVATSVAADEAEVLFASLDGKMWRYDIRNGRMLTDAVGTSVASAEFTRDSRCLVASCLDSRVRLFDKDDGALLAEYTGHLARDYYVRAETCFDDSLVVSGSEDGNLWVWRALSSEVVAKLEHPEGGLVNGSAHPKENVFLSICKNFLRVWEVKEVVEVEETS